MKKPKVLYLAPSSFDVTNKGTDMYDEPMEAYGDMHGWSSPPNPIVKQCRYVDLSQVWHKGDEDPKLHYPCLLQVGFRLEDESVIDCITAWWGEYGWSEENFPNNATDVVVTHWAYLHELTDE